jgi:MFS family permease
MRTLHLTPHRIFQAIAPSFLAGLSDYMGRRVVMMLSLSVYIIICIGIALTPTDALWLLMIFRALQATGGSPSIATGAGAMGDIAIPAERGKHVGLFQGTTMVGPAFGPVLGGALVQYLSWRWIFWVLAMWCGSNVICIFL